jgi:hypothetical protein
MPTVLERLGEPLNWHDLDAMLDCFDHDYRSEQPAHPNRGFGGREQVRKNWSGMFESFPDFPVRAAAARLGRGSRVERVALECHGSQDGGDHRHGGERR